MTEVHDVSGGRCQDEGGGLCTPVNLNRHLRVRDVIWNGTLREQLDLIMAIQHNCACGFDSTGVRVSVCSSHAMLGKDQRALDGLLWARHLLRRLRAEEGVTA